jgi:hypothetical protein
MNFNKAHGFVDIFDNIKKKKDSSVVATYLFSLKIRNIARNI